MRKNQLPLKIALVGCGKAADNHVAQIQHIPDVSLVAVCDRELLMAEQLAKRYSIPKSYADYPTMLATECPDAVHIATPPQSHFDLAKIAFERGYHVLVEKPATCSNIETERLLSIAQAADRKLTVAWGYHFDPVARDMRKMIRSGAIGEVVHVNSHFGYDLDAPFGRSIVSDSNHWVRTLPAKLIHNVADHIFNKVVEFLPGQEPAITAMIWSNDAGSSADYIPTEMRVLIKDGPVTATAIFSSVVRPVLHRFQVFGTKGSLSLDFTSGILCEEHAPCVRGVMGSLLSGYRDAWERFTYTNGNAIRLAHGQFGYFAGLQFLFRAFYQSIRQDCPPPIPYDLILKVSTLVDRILSEPRFATCNQQRIA